MRLMEKNRGGNEAYCTAPMCLLLLSMVQILRGPHGLLPVAVLSALIKPSIVMLLQHILEFDTAVGFHDLLDALSAQGVQLAAVDFQPCRQHVHHHGDFHRQLEQQTGDTIFTALDCGPQGGNQCGGQEICDLLAYDVIAVEAYRLFYKLVLTSAVGVGKLCLLQYRLR